MNKGGADIFVCDAGPLIHLDELGCLELLLGFKTILVPAGVWEETVAYRPAVKKLRNFKMIGDLTPRRAELLILCEIFSLHPGEKSALACLEEMPGAMFLTDDSAARLVAERLGYKAHGTIGIVIRAIRRGQMTSRQVIDILASIPDRSTLHIKPSLLEEIIRTIKGG